MNTNECNLTFFVFLEHLAHCLSILETADRNSGATAKFTNLDLARRQRRPSEPANKLRFTQASARNLETRPLPLPLDP